MQSKAQRSPPVLQCEKANGLGRSDILFWTAVKDTSSKTVLWCDADRTGDRCHLLCVVGWSRRGQGCLSLESGVCCQVASMPARCLVQGLLPSVYGSACDLVIWWHNVLLHIHGPCRRGRTKTEFAPITCRISQFVNTVCTLYTIHCTLYTLHCTLCTIHCTLHCTLYTVHYTLYTLHCTLCTIHHTLYTVHYTLYTYSIHCALYTIHCTLYTVHYTLYTVHYTVHCTLCTIHCTLYTVHCALYTIHCTLYTYSIHCTLHTLHCTLCTIHYKLYTIHCTLCTNPG